jgi:precorrin-6Y C5,15-methyltransferase (decarboxylating)
MSTNSNELFSNERILAWMAYYADQAGLDLEKMKILDITKKNRNLIPTVEQNRTVLVLTDAGHPEIFYTMWDAGLGSCEIWYNEGSEPGGPIKHAKVADMIDRGINASAAMVICNPNASGASRIGMNNEQFSAGSIRYVGSEIRSIIMNKLHVGQQDTLCIISGESIAVEAAMLAGEGDVIAVEYNRNDRAAMEENVQKFGLNNVHIIDNMEPGTLMEGPTPTVAFIVADSRLEMELNSLLARNPKLQVVVYTLELDILTHIPEIFARCGIQEEEVVQVSVSKLNAKRMFVAQPSPWIITGSAR